MAIVTRRYKQSVTTLADDNVGRLPAATGIGGIGGVGVIDCLVDNTVANFAADVDEAMVTLGFEFVSTGPSDTAFEAMRILNEFKQLRFGVITADAQIALLGVEHINICNISAGSKEILFPPTPTANDVVRVKNINNAQLSANGNGKNIDGAATKNVKKFDNLTALYTGTEWFIVGGNY